MSKFYDLNFPQYPEFAYELLLQYDMVVNQQTRVGGFRSKPIRYWRLEKEKVSYDTLHGEAEDEQLYFASPYIFPVFFEEQKKEYDLTRYGMDGRRATGKLALPISVLAVLGLVSRQEDEENMTIRLAPGDRFQWRDDLYEVLYVSPNEAKHLSSSISLYINIFGQYARDLSIQLPKDNEKTLPEVLNYELIQTTAVTPTVG